MPPTDCTRLTATTMGATAITPTSGQRVRSALSLEEVLALYGPIGLTPMATDRRTTLATGSGS